MVVESRIIVQGRKVGKGIFSTGIKVFINKFDFFLYQGTGFNFGMDQAVTSRYSPGSSQSSHYFPLGQISYQHTYYQR